MDVSEIFTSVVMGCLKLDAENECWYAFFILIF
ncbi:hypothetical protein T4B_8091 [Trichinella pseudospiralis]|uniref:Uncharacterized protein n=1 Tax=Trichinella pseudospiralis TaxID=6337 RepID=A0A0V1GSJ3_TRIPS|nr:hypothetical protein T4B_8091 [Trichinella pseudospiralis]KRZ00947.1 hypothetical protein T4C_9375 [Trichinella pseudospiralis]